MAGPFAGGGTGAVVPGGQAVAARPGGPAEQGAAGTAAAVSPAAAIRLRRVSGRRPRRAWFRSG